jgi:hypothetical protein
MGEASTIPSYTCSVCEGVSDRLLRCGRCMGRSYCGQECQRKDWRSGHKERCVLLGSEPELYGRETMAVLGGDTVLMQTLTMLLYAARQVPTRGVCRYLMLIAVNKPWRAESAENYHPLLFCVVGEMPEGDFLRMVERDVGRTSHTDVLTDPRRVPLIMIRSVRADPVGDRSTEEPTSTRYVSCSTDCVYPWTEERSTCTKGCCANASTVQVKRYGIAGRGGGESAKVGSGGKEGTEELGTAEDFRLGGAMVLQSIFETRKGSFSAADFVSGRCAICLSYEPGSLVANGPVMVLEHVAHIRLLTDPHLRTGRQFTITLR